MAKKLTPRQKQLRDLSKAVSMQDAVVGLFTVSNYNLRQVCAALKISERHAWIVLAHNRLTANDDTANAKADALFATVAS
jgi:hypothetical protein